MTAVDPTTAFTQRKELSQSGPKRMVGFQPTNRERWMRRGDLQSCTTKASFVGWKPTLRSLPLHRSYLELPPVKYMIPKNRAKADCHND